MSSQDTSLDNNKNSFSRYIKIDDWLFEIKMVRALKVNEYGLPYEAIANCNINGDSMYVDGLLTKNDKEFTREDFATFHKFGHQIGVERMSYHRYHNGESVTKDLPIQVNPNNKININTETKLLFEQVIRIVK
jgi:hypothetical protein